MGKIVDDFLYKNKKDESTISNSLKKNLSIVEKEIENRLRAIESAQKIIKENSINIKVISESTHISRKTFYNNPLLSSLVEEYSTSSTKATEEVKRLKARMSDIEEKLLKMLDRDADTEILRFQKSKLELELETSHKRIETLERQHEEDLKKQGKEIIKTKNYFDA